MIQTKPIKTANPATGDRPVLGVGRTDRPVFALREALDGATLRMRFLWVQTADMWVMGLESDSGAVIRARSLPLTASGVDLWATVQADARMPGGQLWIAWGDQRPRSPGRLDWRGDATLYYRPSALVAAVAGTALELF
jgi:hypothetical protein